MTEVALLKIQKIQQLQGDEVIQWLKILIVSFFESGYELPVHRALREDPLTLLGEQAAIQGLKLADKKGLITDLEICPDTAVVRFNLP